MPKTFYLSFEVVPSDEGLVDSRIVGGQAHCWVVEDDPISALVKATYRVKQSGWAIQALESEPTPVRLEDFRERDLGEKAFLEAQEHGIAVFTVAHTPAKDLHSDEPIRQKRHGEFDLNDFIRTQHAIRSQGRCLFYQTTDKCSEVIDAHSIQKNGALSMIARDGHVYSISPKFTDIKRSKGRLTLTQTHINAMSVFRGLCHHHDSLLFRPIDLGKLKPTDEQAFLYAYRCILKERYAKECVVETLDQQLRVFCGTRATQELIDCCREGNQLGLSGLKSEQANYDESHRQGRFDDIRYVMFESLQPPTAVFSGQIYPDWGFNGEPIQNLADRTTRRALLTFSFAPTDAGWAFLFAWHKVSDDVCRYFISTLQSAIRGGQSIEDLLFGLVVKGCENTAYSPDWIDQRTAEERRLMEDAMTHGADVLKIVEQDYLMSGQADFHGWRFDSVSDNLPRSGH
jgi:hypothetical protein